MTCGCVVRFYFLSAECDAGYGTGEKHCGDCDYTELNSIHNWRQTLSSFYLCTLYDDYGNTFTSIIQMYKCIIFFSKHQISYSKCYTIFSHLNQKESKATTKIDNLEILEYVVKSKYESNHKLNRVLKLTGTSKLVYYKHAEDYIENLDIVLENERGRIRKEML